MTNTFIPVIAAQRDPQGKLTPIVVPEISGPPGASAWTPMLAGEQDGVRTLIKVIDWMGGTGTKPAVGYIGTAGMVATKAAAFNFNSAKRTAVFQAVTNAQGIATVAFSPAFPLPPNIVFFATSPVLAGAVKVEEVSSSRTASQVQIRVQQQGLLTAVLTLVAGATVTVIAIEN